MIGSILIKCCLLVLYTLIATCLFAQETIISLQPFHVNRPYQKSNNFILTAEKKLISSIDGLVILNGQTTQVLIAKPGELFDKLIQSDFYPDSTGNVWFCSYSGLYKYDFALNSLSGLRLVDTNSDTLYSDYRIVDKVGNSIFFSVGDEVIEFDLTLNKQKNNWCMGSCVECDFAVMDTKPPILYAGNSLGLERMQLLPSGEIENRLRLLKEPITDLIYYGSDLIVATRQKKLLQLREDRLFKEFTDNHVTNTLHVIGGRLLLNYYDHIRLLDMALFQKETIRFKNGKTPLGKILDIEIDTDSILWVTSEGNGVFFANLKMPFEDAIQFDDTRKLNVSVVHSNAPEEILLFSTNEGVVSLNQSDPSGANHFSKVAPDNYRKATPYEAGYLCYNSLLSTLDLLQTSEHGYRISRLFYPHAAEPEFYQISTLIHGAVLGSTNRDGLGYVNVDAKNYTFSPFAIPIDNQKSYTYFQELEDKRLLISYNEEEIHVFSPDPVKYYVQTDRIPITGGVWTVYEYPGDSLIYLGNSNGLFTIHETSLEFEPLYDKEENLPCQTYCMTGDTMKYLWISTNNGILRYHIPTQSTHRFTQRHGVTSSEFNSHAMYVDKDHKIYFGGTEGVTVFNPYEVKLSEKEAPVDVYGFKINDEETKAHGLPRNIDTLRLPYTDNTISFEFQAIDYSDVTATRVRYKMSDYDKDWITAPDARGFARYANLQPGHYTLSLIGLNADGVPGKEIKTIDITIVPPYYMTWWFRILVAASILALGYVIVRAYYKRKLERKDLLLKHQSLLIEKQRAVEYERNRIAAEMHDDLGSGLTRIKYLSERALRIAENEKESDQIRRIADQSNQLVTNMSEIIWAMNSRFDTAESLSGYIRRYASEYLEEHQMPVTFFVGSDGQVAITAEKRRNVFLVVKEVLHNTVKYSQARTVEIHMPMTGDVFEINIIEKQSVGFDPDTAEKNGNGIHNMRRRMQSIQGTVTFSRIGNDMSISIKTPLAS